MKLLLDQNLSPRLVRSLADVYPDSIHMHALEMDRASDSEIWRYAVERGYTVVSKDMDFHQRSLLLGAPPKVIWMRVGNSSVADDAALLRARYIEIRRFHDDTDAAFLVLS